MNDGWMQREMWTKQLCSYIVQVILLGQTIPNDLEHIRSGFFFFFFSISFHFLRNPFNFYCIAFITQDFFLLYLEIEESENVDNTRPLTGFNIRDGSQSDPW